MLDLGLQGRTALVTGANHGIGAATARALAAQGTRVAISYLRPDPDASYEPDPRGIPGDALFRRLSATPGEMVAKSIQEAGGQAAALEIDLSAPASIPAVFDWAESTFGPVEVLVNNAAHCEPDTFLPQAYDKGNERDTLPLTALSHDRHFAVNSRAVALMMHEFGRRHIARGARWGRIINISTDGSNAFASEVSYGASKHAMESYSRAAAIEFGPFGITVNIISPGPIQTGWMPPELEARCLQETPLGRTGQPQDIADAVVLLASEQARWITGQLLFVGGGHKMGM